MKIIDVEQGSDEWFEWRLGSIGGSSIQSVCAEGTGKTRSSLLYRFAGEILSGEKYSGYQNKDMERGLLLEPDARTAYEFIVGCDVAQVGMFQYQPYQHYSPDGDLKKGIIEIKCPIPSVHIETILSDRVPAAYRKQCQWGLLERDWCDYISYCPLVVDQPIWVKRLYRDKVLIRKMKTKANQFVQEMLEIVEKIKKG